MTHVDWLQGLQLPIFLHIHLQNLKHHIFLFNVRNNNYFYYLAQAKAWEMRRDSSHILQYSLCNILLADLYQW